MRGRLALAVVAALALSGCEKKAGAPAWLDFGKPHGGRFQGVGVYTPGEAWSRVVGDAGPTDSNGAARADDGAVIVTVDSATGEIRACGDLSGRCVRQNPWQAKALAAPAVVEPPPPEAKGGQ
ncbi:MAG TPA: hypothetical protein VG939_12545 [Caulobacteraceae bacterium]|nr:hypothetical protein [Caulobacteraceae bacterium]